MNRKEFLPWLRSHFESVENFTIYILTALPLEFINFEETVSLYLKNKFFDTQRGSRCSDNTAHPPPYFR
jgi:hypothetical protein